jgi:hypothetical protein
MAGARAVLHHARNRHRGRHPSRDSIDGRDLVGHKGGGGFAGIVFPCRWPGNSNIVLN